MNVLVYAGPEVIQSSPAQTISALRSILSPNYSVQPITAKALASHPWSETCALLVFPGLREPYRSSSSSVVKSYLENGGAFLGLATGARCWASGTKPDLKSCLLFSDRASGYTVSPTFSEGSEVSSRSRAVEYPGGVSRLAANDYGPRSILGFEGAENASPLAHYAKDESDTTLIAAIKCHVNQGRLVLWAASPETSPELRDLLARTIEALGLQIPIPEVRSPARPLPQFLIGHPGKPFVLERIYESLLPSLEGQTRDLLTDANDSFQFHSFSAGTALLNEIRTSSVSTTDDPANSQPRHIIICTEGQIPSTAQTPLFDLASYFSSLSSAREKESLAENAEPWGLGEALLYGEAVSSTQTLLDKNPKFASSLPCPILSLASIQLSGRGRGSNVWLSPPGCLMFSILLRLPLSSAPAPKIVFAQYLFSLAVVEACREETVLGERGGDVRIKWPNDIYATLAGEKKKIGGILVNTSFSGGRVDLVIGCGLNVLNPPPIASLSQIGGVDRQPPSMEGTAAAIMAKFEKMWSTFLSQRGSFEPFMDLYLDRWLHSDQLVTLTTTAPHKKVRIVGITSDFGLLRTLPENENAGYIDLQPDGNSFDLMAGMIRTKT